MRDKFLTSGNPKLALSAKLTNRVVGDIFKMDKEIITREIGLETASIGGIYPSYIILAKGKTYAKI